MLPQIRAEKLNFLKDPFAKQILSESIHKLEIKFEPDQTALEKVFGSLGVWFDHEKQFKVEIAPDSTGYL